MVREDLVNSAVSFLQDPSVASAPLDKRIAFLQSKNLTQAEINVSLARASASDATPETANPPSSAPNYAYQGPPPPGFGSYPGYWQPPPPPEVPRRDWRDWFIMATVMGGVGFGLYVSAKRYILPLIKPPTPPQLTQDKESIDESFTKAFALLEQLETDTKTLKEAEEARTTRLDASLSELESVISSLKESDRKREDDARRNADEIRMLRDLIPKALESEKNATDTRMKDLTNELKSLKTLMGNRMGVGSSGSSSAHRPTASFGTGPTSATNGTSAAAHSPTVAPATTSTSSANAQSSTDAATTSDTAKPAATSPRSTATSPFPRFGSGKAAIPAWQMAAAKKSQDNLKMEASESGTATEEPITEASGLRQEA